VSRAASHPRARRRRQGWSAAARTRARRGVPRTRARTAGTRRAPQRSARHHQHPAPPPTSTTHPPTHTLHPHRHNARDRATTSPPPANVHDALVLRVLEHLAAHDVLVRVDAGAKRLGAVVAIGAAAPPPLRAARRVVVVALLLERRREHQVKVVAGHHRIDFRVDVEHHFGGVGHRVGLDARHCARTNRVEGGGEGQRRMEGRAVEEHGSTQASQYQRAEGGRGSSHGGPGVSGAVAGACAQAKPVGQRHSPPLASAASPHTPRNKHQQQECHAAQRET